MSSDDSTNIERQFTNLSQSNSLQNHQSEKNFLQNFNGFNVLFEIQDKIYAPKSISEIPERMLSKLTSKLTFVHLDFNLSKFPMLESSETFTVLVLRKKLLFDGKLFEFKSLNVIGLEFGGGVYFGQVLGNVPNGFGVLKLKGCKFVGEFENGNPVNKGFFIGQYRTESGLLYQGETCKQSFTGNGKITFPNQETYEGSLLFNHLNGNGTYIFEDGSKYEGEFIKNRKEGQGIYYWSEKCYFEGIWKDDLPEGRGIFKKENGTSVEGVWKSGKLISIISKIKEC